MSSAFGQAPGSMSQIPPMPPTPPEGLEAAGLADSRIQTMFTPAAHATIAAFLAGKTRKQLDALALAKDIPLHTMK